MQLITVADVYGRKSRISLDDFNDLSRTQLRLYDRRGRPLELNGNAGKCISIHRDNILTVEG